MLCAGLIGIGAISALDAGSALAKAKKVHATHAAKINASNYGVTCTGQSGSTSFSPPLKFPGTTSGGVKLSIKATLSHCTATPPSGGAPLTISKGVVTGKLEGSKGTSCLQSVEDGGSFAFSGTLKIKWTTSPKITSGITRVGVGSGAVGFVGNPPDQFNTLTFPGDNLGTVAGSFSANPSESFSYSQTNETLSSFLQGCASATGLKTVTDGSGLADFGVPPSSITVTQTSPAGLFSIPAGTGASYTATAAYPGYPAFDVNSRVTWTSSNPSVAVFTGLAGGIQDKMEGLNPLAAGTTQISASIGIRSSPPITLTVLPALAIVTTSLPDGQVGVPYDQFVTATGGVAPYTWAGGDFPPGLSINPTTGEVTGTPTTVGTFSDAIFEVNDSYSPGSELNASFIPITIDP